jgi:hypothetical protein
MKLTDEERKELKELYNSYYKSRDVESLKLLGGLIKTSKWYKNHKLTLRHIDSYIYLMDGPDCDDGIYSFLTLKEILDTRCYERQRLTYIPTIIRFLKRIVTHKNITLYKPV